MQKNDSSIVGIIPARYGSTRFPGKSLALIQDKPMIQWVYERATRSRYIERVIVATDDERILQTVRSFGGDAVMTARDHPTGTDRIAEVARSLTCDIVVNIQGDEPLIPPEMIDQAITPLIQDHAIQMGTVSKQIENDNEAFDPNVVKVVVDHQGFALYFSRSPIPWNRNAWAGIKNLDKLRLEHAMYKHIGLYVYRKDFLLSYASLPQMPLEKVEMLEQLRAIEQGIKIRVVTTEHESFGVDIPEDLGKIQKLLNGGRT